MKIGEAEVGFGCFRHELSDSPCSEVSSFCKFLALPSLLTSNGTWLSSSISCVEFQFENGS